MPAARCATGPLASATGARGRASRWSRRWWRRRRVPDDKPMPYRIVDRAPGARPDDREAVVAALLENPARISPKYFYDELGCALYGAICRLPEYYPTRTEMAIFRDHRSAIAAAAG